MAQQPQQDQLPRLWSASTKVYVSIDGVGHLQLDAGQDERALVPFEQDERALVPFQQDERALVPFEKPTPTSMVEMAQVRVIEATPISIVPLRSTSYGNDCEKYCWMKDGWTVEERIRTDGRTDRFFYSPSPKSKRYRSQRKAIEAMEEEGYNIEEFRIKRRKTKNVNQSYWTNQAVEVDTPQPTSPWDLPDSTCAQVIHPKHEALGNGWVSAVAEKNECPECDGKLFDNVPMGKDLEIGVPRSVQGYESEKVRTDLLGAKHDKMPELIPVKDNEQLDKGLLKLNCEKLVSKLRAQFAGHTGLAINRTNSRPQIKASEVPNGPLMVSEFKDKTICYPKELPSLELSLKRLTGAGDIGTTAHGECNILKHSGLSAFSRYNNTASAANQAPSGNVGSNRQP